MTAIDPSEDHPEAITLGLHDASPPHMVDAMAKDVELELGWGKLIFGQTFADAATLTVRIALPVPEVGDTVSQGLFDVAVQVTVPDPFCVRCTICAGVCEANVVPAVVAP